MEKNFKLKNFLFIIAHPDDEVVGATTIIKKLLEEKNKVYIFFLTNGVISEKYLMFWQKKNIKKMKIVRKSEMKLSLKELGINDFFFQDIPTRSLKEKIYDTYLKIKKIIVKNKIDVLFCPAYEGGHQDHDVANFICSKFQRKCDIYEYPEYNFYNNKINCNSFFDKRGNQKIHILSDQEKFFKKNCLKIYSSERKNLGYIKFDKESYRRLQKYDYSQPPHLGILFYRRYSFFSWHPRVDADKPEKICQIITSSKIFNFK